MGDWNQILPELENSTNLAVCSKTAKQVADFFFLYQQEISFTKH